MKLTVNGITLVLGSLFIFCADLAFAQPDFGYYAYWGGRDGEERRWVPGIADDLSEADKARFRKVKSSMHSYRFNSARRNLVKLLEFTSAHPNAQCEDKFSDDNVFLQCTDGALVRNYGGLMSLDVNSVLDDQVITPMEKYNAQEQAWKERQMRQAMQDQSSPVQTNPSKRQVQSANGFTNSTGSSGSSVGKVYRLPASNTASASYQNYISNHIAPGSRSSGRGNQIVFSEGTLPVISTLPSGVEDLSYTPSETTGEQSDSE